MRTALEQAQYDTVISFDWWVSSLIPITGRTVIAGVGMAERVRQAASQLATLPDDVIDVHFIGHSRGAVVISQALLDLERNPGRPSLESGYYKMTMLDPHPARNSVPGPQGVALGLAQVFNSTGDNTIGSFSLDTGLGFGGRLSRAGVVLSFQAAVQDPGVVIPVNVDFAESYYQRKRGTGTSGFDRAAGLNLWGELPSAIVNRSTGMFVHADVGFFVTGHTGVPFWYLTLV